MLRTVKAVFFYIIRDLLYETKVTNVTKLLKAHVKIRSFLWVIVNMSRRNILLVAKLHSLGYEMQYNVNTRSAIFTKAASSSYSTKIATLQSTVLY